MEWSRRNFLLAAATAEAVRPPNIVLITADNLGYGDLGCYGNRVIRTPNLDRFASQGVRFTNFYTASPTCTASRAGLLTGRHPLRYGLNYQLSAEENKRGIGLPHTETLLPAYLKPRGYVTGCFGKWNLGFAPGSRPTERGFDEFFGHRSGNMHDWTHVYNGDHDLYQGIEPVHREGYSTHLFAGAACDFLRRHRDKPVFLYLPFSAPHYPNPRNHGPGETVEWGVPVENLLRYGYSRDEQDQEKRYHAVITALDDGFGRVMRTIEDSGAPENTLVVFFSDNGAFMLPGRGLEVASNRPLRGGGVTCWEGGIRVAALARWPGKIVAGQTSNHLLSSMDLTPLFARAAGAGLPRDRVFDGVDPANLLTGKAGSSRRALFFEYQKHQAVREGSSKLIRLGPDQPWMLFDMNRDAGETKDLATQNAGRARQLGGRFQQWRSRFP